MSDDMYQLFLNFKLFLKKKKYKLLILKCWIKM